MPLPAGGSTGSTGSWPCTSEASHRKSPLRRRLVHSKLDLGRAHQAPAALVGVLADHLGQLATQRRLGLLEPFGVVGGQRERRTGWAPRPR